VRAIKVLLVNFNSGAPSSFGGFSGGPGAVSATAAPAAPAASSALSATANGFCLGVDPGQNRPAARKYKRPTKK